MQINPRNLGTWSVKYLPEHGVWLIIDSDTNSQVGMARSEETATLMAAVPGIMQFLASIVRWRDGPTTIPATTMLEQYGIEIEL